MTPSSSHDNAVGTAPEQIELIERGAGIINDNPSALAEIVLRDLFCRAHRNNITACVQPILTYDRLAAHDRQSRFLFLRHLDNHVKWIPVDFPKYIFAEIMNSIKVGSSFLVEPCQRTSRSSHQHHNSYLAIELLLGHLERHFDQDDKVNIKPSIMNVIQDCMVFAAADTGAGRLDEPISFFDVPNFLDQVQLCSPAFRVC